MKRVRCISDKDTDGLLVIGRIYTVVSETSQHYDLKEESSMQWFKGRFEDVKESTGSDPLDCACGIRRSECEYHKS